MGDHILEKRDTAEVRLEGDINFRVSPEVRNTLLTACKKDIRQVVVDFSSVTSIDTSGVATLIEGLRWSRKEGKSFVLKNVGTNVRNTLSLAKLETAFQIMPAGLDS
jgi:anti-sigma B factor antagonist